MAKTERKRPAAPAVGIAETIITASSQLLQGLGRETYAITYKDWQDELWEYYVTVGEFGAVMDWFAAGFGRMHLRAAVWKKDATEPTFITEGPAAELVRELVATAKGGETQFLRSWGKHLSIAGVGYLVRQNWPDGRITHDVKSADVVKRSARQFPERGTPEGKLLSTYDIRVAPDEWVTLDPNDSFVARIFDPDPRYDYLPTSMTRAARATLREIDLINRAITATLLSRIAFNGILLIPTEATFPVNPQFKDAPDPWIAEIIQYASRGIKDPGAPSAAIPFPMRVGAEHIDMIKHLVLSTGMDPKIIDARKSAVERLSEQLPAPPEAMSGISDLNHWNAATQTEENVKMYFAPPMELLVGGLTASWLYPLLESMGQPTTDEKGQQIVVWYDATDLTTDPDNSENATIGADSVRITDEAWRATAGFSDDDKPSDEEKKLQILTQLAAKGTSIPDSFWLLFPEEKKKMDAIAPPPPVLVPGDPNSPGAGRAGNAVGPSASAKPAPGKEPAVKAKP